MVIDDHGCVSGVSNEAVVIGQPLPAPVIICMEEDYTSVVVEWEDVPGLLPIWPAVRPEMV